MKRISYLLIIALVGVMSWFQIRYQRTALPVIKTAPSFDLQERNGAKVTNQDLLGKVWLADFFYSTCPGPCPMISTSVAGLQDEVLKLSPDTRIVSISLDPAKDTPEVLRKYAENYHASKDRWLFLTGDPGNVEEVVSKGFWISYARAEDEKRTIIHGTQLALVDRKGCIRAFYDGAKLDKPEQILADMQAVLAEK